MANSRLWDSLSPIWQLMWRMLVGPFSSAIPGHFECATPVRTLKGHKDFVLSLAYSDDGRFVVSGSKDRGVYLWDVETGQPLIVLQGHKNSVISVGLAPVPQKLLPQGTIVAPEILLASGSGDQRARVWRVKVPAHLRPLVVGGGPSTNGQVLSYPGDGSEPHPHSQPGQYGDAPPPSGVSLPSVQQPHGWAPKLTTPTPPQPKNEAIPQSATPFSLPAMRTSPHPPTGPQSSQHSHGAHGHNVDSTNNSNAPSAHSGGQPGSSM